MKRLFAELERGFYENLDVTPTTKEDYRRIFDQFKKWVVIGGYDINTLCRADILAYKSWLINSGKSESTMDIYLLVVRRFYEFVEESGEGENIAAGIRYKRKNHEYYKEHLQEPESEALLGSIDTSTLIGMRDYAMIYLMLSTGFRCVEVSRLLVEDIHDEEKFPYLNIQRKGYLRKDTKFGVTEEILQPIYRYLSERGVEDKQEPLFASTRNHRKAMLPRDIGRVIRLRMRAAGIYSSKKTAHSLRHTAAIRAIKANVPIRDVQIMLGHHSVETTEIYLRSIDNETRLSNPAIRKMPKLPSNGSGVG